MKVNAFIGIDMGATHTRLCILDENRHILKLEKFVTSIIVSDGVANGVEMLISHEVKELDLNIIRIVIGLPATVSKDRKKVLSTPNINVNIDDFNKIVDQLNSEFNCPVELERDVNLQAAYDIDNFNIVNKTVLGCYLGSGFGFSIWINGDVYTGAHGVAGELGHIPYGDDSRVCGCENRGCLETVLSGVRLKEEYDSQNAMYPLSEFFLQPLNDGFIEQFVLHAAKAVAAASNLFDPDVVILGGGVIDMNGFPYEVLTKETLKRVRSPLPHDELTLFKANSSSFNGASGAAIQALKRTK